MTKSIAASLTTIAAQQTSRGLARWEVSAIAKAAKTIPGGWAADVFDCECCGKTTAVVAPICEAVASPTFEFSRDDQKVRLTITPPDGEDYDVEVASVPEALSVMRFEISMAPKASMAFNG